MVSGNPVNTSQLDVGRSLWRIALGEATTACPPCSREREGWQLKISPSEGHDEVQGSSVLPGDHRRGWWWDNVSEKTPFTATA